MNELALIFDRLGIDTEEVLKAAGTKWNFLPFRPGLVGGHCIGVDPYYLTTKAQQLGYQPEVILAGRRVNDNMGCYIAQRLVKLLVNADVPVRGARVGVLGLTFKENVTDIRNSKVPDIIRELAEFGIKAIVHDPIASAQETHHEYGIELSPWSELASLDALVVAVSHDEYTELGDKIFAPLRDGGVVIDVKSMFAPAAVEGVGRRLRYWSL
jgi:UDP-N-acetyl-D-galactosamine dehydrogenase